MIKHDVPIDHIILSNLENLRGVLTFTEIGVIVVLKNSNIPLTVRDVRNRYMDGQKDWLHEKKDMDFNNSFLMLEKAILKDDIKNFIKDYAKLVEKKPTKTEHFRQLEKLLKNMGIRIPSYETFNRTLETLEKLGITSNRPEPDKKRGVLWFLNPKFRKVLDEKHIEFSF